jgi:two-component system, sensor histidine kinase
MKENLETPHSATTTSTPPDVETQATSQLLHDYFQAIRATWYVVPLVPLIVVTVMWGSVDRRLLIGWGALIIAGIAAQQVLGALFLARHGEQKHPRRWAWRATLATAFLGTLWGASPFLFHVDGSMPHELFIVTINLLLGTYAVLGGMYWLPIYYVYAGPILGSLIVHMALQDGLAYAALAALFSVALLLSFIAARAINRIVRSEISLRHDSERLSDAFREKSEEAERATEAKSRFLAAASHDLRQPLYALALFVDLLKESRENAEREVLIPRIATSLENLSELFDALMDISRLDGATIETEPSHFDLRALLDRLAEENAGLAMEKGLEIRVHGVVTVVETDQTLLYRILQNLIGNAINYTQRGGVLLGCRSRGEHVLVQVWDTGLGIPAAEQKTVFEEYYQLDNPNRDRDRGLGLGLAIVQRLCTLLGLRLALRSVAGRGSVFSLRIARGDPALVEARPVATSSPSWVVRGRCVLVIDDERDIREATSRLLEGWGCQVVAAASADEALEQLLRQGRKPDLALCDLRLSGGENGVDAIERVRRRYGGSVAGIILTGDTAEADVLDASRNDIDVLHKPVQPIRLRRVVQSVLAASGSSSVEPHSVS